MVVCGLTSVDLSSLTAWQQTILFVQMCLGNPVRSPINRSSLHRPERAREGPGVLVRCLS
jgi:hypothetical protein